MPPQRFRDELPKLLPEVDAFMGIDQVAQVNDIVRQALQHRNERLKTKATSRKADKAKLIGRFAELHPANGEPWRNTTRNYAAQPGWPAKRVLSFRKSDPAPP